MSKNTRTRILLTAVAALLLVVVSVAGTLAWLQDTSGPVLNTFEPSNINVEIAESDDLDLKMIPGSDITKDPKVSVTTNDVAAWVFVEITKGGDFDNFMDFTLADGWTVLTGDDKNFDGNLVIYREVAAGTYTGDAAFGVLNGDKVSVKNSVTKEQMENAVPTLTFNAYVVQKDAEDLNTPEKAWAVAKPVTP